MNNRRDGGMFLVEWLKAAGVQHVFSVSGGPLNPVFHACSVLGLPLVHARHEAAACFMAEAAARITGAPGVAAVTLGPGVTNTVTPALVAMMAGTPLLIIGAQAPTHMFERGAGMSWDPLPILDSVTKWSARVLDAGRIPEYLEIAWRKMWAGRPGPVFLEIPADIMSANIATAPSGVIEAPPPPPWPSLSSDDSGRLSDALARARRPLVILGDELFWNRPDRLAAAIEKHGVPFTTLRLARGMVDETHELWAGPAYVPCNETLARALGEADLVLLMGHHFEFDLGFGDGVNPAACVVQIASDPDLLGRNRAARLAIQATPASAVGTIAAAPPMSVDRRWTAAVLAGWRDERRAQLGPGADGRMHPVAAIDAVCAAAPENTIFVTSHGNVDFWADARLRMRRPGRYLRAGQAGALGAELPYGVGARFADPTAPVIVFVGDGAVGYHIAELDTAERYGRPVIVVVLDDERWGAIALPQEASYRTTYEMDLPRRDWVRVAEGLGGGGTLASTAEEIAAALAVGLAAGKPHVIQVPVTSVISPYMHTLTR
jgi:thiamine pyrophosphate-dependent acetolactate synthase large subunit-like protein